MPREQLGSSPLSSVWGDTQAPQMTAKPLALSSGANDQRFFLTAMVPRFHPEIYFSLYAYV